MCVTDDDELALRMKLIRNHGENAVEPLGIQNMINLVGFNYRLTEIQAAVGIEQLKRIDEHVEKREQLGKALTEATKDIKGFTPPKVRSGCRHVYYVWGLRFEEKTVGVSRDLFCRALNAEGFPVFQGYTKPLYLLPVFKKRIAIGAAGFPFNGNSDMDYGSVSCPVCERMFEREFIGFEPCAFDVDKESLALLIEAVNKVYSYRYELKSLETEER
jgi:dTDP-4-amino-4,6-dideoxygalactose transaminase